MIRIILTLFLFMSSNANALDLREYFPESYISTFRTANGAINTRYTFTNAPSGYLSLYNTYLTLNKSGSHYTWKKEYYKAGSWCTATVGILFMADDKSVTEVGDWMSRGGDGCTPNTVFGYKNFTTNTNTGLVWSPANGLTESPAIHEMNTASQDSPGAAYQLNGYQAFSKTGVIEVLDTYTPPYGKDISGNWCAGCSKTYNDVVHIVMYHGTKNATSAPIRCSTTSPIAATGAYYQSFKNYNAYAIELWLAKGKGVIQESTPFIEDASYWLGAFPNCSGNVFSAPQIWRKFIDEN
jgi:hypothetical protein